MSPDSCRQMIDLTAKHHALHDQAAAERIKAIPTPLGALSNEELRGLISKAAKKEK